MVLCSRCYNYSRWGNRGTGTHPRWQSGRAGISTQSCRNQVLLDVYSAMQLFKAKSHLALEIPRQFFLHSLNFWKPCTSLPKVLRNDIVPNHLSTSSSFNHSTNLYKVPTMYFRVLEVWMQWWTQHNFPVLIWRRHSWYTKKPMNI